MNVLYGYGHLFHMKWHMLHSSEPNSLKEEHYRGNCLTSVNPVIEQSFHTCIFKIT